MFVQTASLHGKYNGLQTFVDTCITLNHGWSYLSYYTFADNTFEVVCFIIHVLMCRAFCLFLSFFSRFNDGVVSLHVTRQVSAHDEKTSHFSTGIFTGIVYEIFIFNRVILGEKYFVRVSFSFLFLVILREKSPFRLTFHMTSL